MMVRILNLSILLLSVLATASSQTNLAKCCGPSYAEGEFGVKHFICDLTEGNYANIKRVIEIKETQDNNFFLVQKAKYPLTMNLVLASKYTLLDAKIKLKEAEKTLKHYNYIHNGISMGSTLYEAHNYIQESSGLRFDIKKEIKKRRKIKAFIKACIKAFNQQRVKASYEEYADFFVGRRSCYESAIEQLRKKILGDSLPPPPPPVSNSSLDSTVVKQIVKGEADRVIERIDQLDLSQIGGVGTPGQATAPHFLILTESIFFSLGSYKIQQQYQEELDRLVAFYKADCRRCAVVINGFTDAIGDDEANLKLSEKRAKKVQVKLMQAGIDPSLISINYFGELGDGANNARKVEIRLYGPKKVIKP